MYIGRVLMYIRRLGGEISFSFFNYKESVWIRVYKCYGSYELYLFIKLWFYIVKYFI